MKNTFESNLADFNKQIEGYTKDMMPKAAIEVQKKIVLEALRRVVEKTPVDTGRARGNWQANIESPANSQLDVTDKDGAATVSRAMKAISNLPPYSVVWISNNVDYIEFLEDGSSKQAPNGMVELTIQELKEYFVDENKIKALKRRQ